MCVLFAFLVLRPGGLLGAAPAAKRRRRGRRERWTTISIGVLSNIGVISFVALSAYLLLLTGEISFGQQAFFAIGAYAAGIATAMWGWPLARGARLGAPRSARGAAVLVGLPTLRLHGLYFAIATLAFAEMVRHPVRAVPLSGRRSTASWSGPNGADGFRGIRYIFENNIERRCSSCC